MALSLQDLLVGLDAGAQAPRVNAPAPRGSSNTSSGSSGSDPFAAAFDKATTPESRSPAPTSDSRSDRPARSDSRNDSTTKPADSAASETDARTDTAPAANAKDADTKAKSTTNETSDAADDATVDVSVNTPATIVAAIVAPLANPVEVTLVATAPATDVPVAPTTNTAKTAPVQAPGLLIANLVASDMADVPPPNDTQPAPDLPKGIAELLAKFTPDSAAANAPTPTVAAAPVETPTAPTTAIETPVATKADTNADTQANTAPADNTNAPVSIPTPVQAAVEATPAPQVDTPLPTQASAVAQVATQAPRDPRATADAVRQVTPNTAAPATPQTPAAQVAVVATQARPADVSLKISQPRLDSAKPATHTTTKASPDEPINTPAKDMPTLAVAPIVPAADDTPIATAIAPAAPIAQGDDAPPSAPSVATPIAAPVAAPQAHQIYAQAAARAPSLPQATVDQVVAHVARAADDGIDHLTIQLRPQHLGAIEVKLEMHDDGSLSKATISADRADTLDLLQRDSHRLERALDNAGLKADAGSLSFNLRGDGGRHQPAFAQQDGHASTSRPTYAGGDDLGADNAVIAYLNARVALGGVDIRV